MQLYVRDHVEVHPQEGKGSSLFGKKKKNKKKKKTRTTEHYNGYKL